MKLTVKPVIVKHKVMVDDDIIFCLEKLGGEEGNDEWAIVANDSFAYTNSKTWCNMFIPGNLPKIRVQTFDEAMSMIKQNCLAMMEALENFYIQMDNENPNPMTNTPILLNAHQEPESRILLP